MARPITISFYNWCINNNRQDLLNLWDYQLNKCSPKDVGFSVRIKYYFKCPRGIHESKRYSLNNLTRDLKQQINCTSCGSFAQWCIVNNHEDWLNLWDYELNKISPYEVSYAANKKYYFKCERQLHKSRLIHIARISTRLNFLKCAECNSFGQWCLDNDKQDLLDRWDYKLNKISPFKISRGKFGKYFFKCPKGIHESEPIELSSIPNNYVKCSKCNSIAQYLIDKYGNNALKLYWDYENNRESPWCINKGSRTKIWIKCINTDYHGSYDIEAHSYSGHEYNCPYCLKQRVHKLDSLGYLYPEVFKIWSSKNKKSPYEYSIGSGQYVWWKCLDNKHKDYYRNISYSVTVNFRCPKCVRERNESFLQEKVRLYLSEELGYRLNHEYDCSLIPQNPKMKNKDGSIDKHGQLPFDNEVVDLHLIIEVNGSQHYYKNSYNGMWGKKEKDPKKALHKRQLYDRYKRYVAYKNGYEYLAIPYTAEKDDKYKQLINDKIEQILKRKTKVK